jgi:hypothetical protein
MRAHELKEPSARKMFILAGDAIVTLVSPTGARYTYRVERSRPQDDWPPVWFVSVLTGPDNENDYRYAGFISATEEWVHGGGRAELSADAPSVGSWAWCWERIAALEPLRGRQGEVEVWHEGSCGRCGRTLTVPESLATGLGPHCATMVAGGAA